MGFKNGRRRTFSTFVDAIDRANSTATRPALPCSLHRPARALATPRVASTPITCRHVGALASCHTPQKSAVRTSAEEAAATEKAAAAAPARSFFVSRRPCASYVVSRALLRLLVSLPDFQVQDVVFSDVVPRLPARATTCAATSCSPRRSASPPPAQRRLTVSVSRRCADGTDVCVHVAGFKPELYYDASEAARATQTVRDRCRRLGHGHDALEADRVMRYDGGDLRLDDEGRRLPSPYWRVRFPTLRAFSAEKYNDAPPTAHHTLPAIESQFFRRAKLTPSGWARLAGGDAPRVVAARDALRARVARRLAVERCGASTGWTPSRRWWWGRWTSRPSPRATSSSRRPTRTTWCAPWGWRTWTAGSPLSALPRRHVITLRSCDPIDGVAVHERHTEADVLLALRDVLIDEVDVLVQFYGFGFDLPYLADRAAAAGCDDAFEYLSKMRFHPTKLKRKTLISSGAGENHMAYFPMPGRANFDFFLWYKMNYKRPTYGLNAIAQEWTGEKKQDSCTTASGRPSTARAPTARRWRPTACRTARSCAASWRRCRRWRTRWSRAACAAWCWSG